MGQGCTKAAVPEGYHDMQAAMQDLKSQQAQLAAEQQEAKRNERELVAREQMNEKKIDNLSRELQHAREQMLNLQKQQKLAPIQNAPKPVKAVKKEESESEAEPASGSDTGSQSRSDSGSDTEEEKHATEAGGDDDLFAGEEADEAKQFMAVKPWKGAIFKPTNPPENNSAAPDQKLVREWVHGYRCHDSRSNLVYNTKGEIIYPAAALVVVFDQNAHKQRYFEGHNDDVICLAQNPADRDIVATGQVATHVDGKKQKPYVCVWNSVTNESWQMPSNLDKKISTVGFSVDGKYVAAAGGDQIVSVYDWKQQKKVAELKSGAKSILQLVWNPHEKDTFVTVGKRHMCTWTFDGGKLKKKSATGLGNQTFICAMFSPSNVCVTGANDGRIYFFKGGQIANKGKGKSVHKKSQVHTLAAYKDGLVSGGQDGRVVILDNKSKQVNTIQFPSKIRSIYVNQKNELLVGTAASEVYEVPTVDRENVEDLSPVVHGHHEGELWGCAASPNQNEFITVGEDNKLFVWDSKTRKLLRSAVISERKGKVPKKGRAQGASTMSRYPVNQMARSVDVSPDGNHIAIGTNEGSVAIYDSTTLKELHFFDLNQYSKRKIIGGGKQNWIEQVKYSPTGKTLAVGTHGSVIVLLAVKNAKTPYKPKGKLTKHSSAITCLDWSEDGKNLQSVDMGYELLFWSVDETKHKNSKHVPHAKSLKDVKWATQSCKFGWPVDGIFIRKNKSAITDGSDINCVDASRDRKLIVTGDDEGNVRMFRYPANGKNDFLAFGGHSSHVMRTVFSRDGKRVFSAGGNDKCVMQWLVS